MSFRVEGDKSDQQSIIERLKQQKLQLGKKGGNVNGAFVGYMPGMLPGNTVDVKYNPNATQTT